MTESFAPARCVWWSVAGLSGRPVYLPTYGGPGNRDDWRAWRAHHGRVDLDGFVRDGYVAVRGAVDADTVAACRELIWAAMERRGVRRDDPGSWPPLVEGMDDLAGDQLAAAYLAPALTAAYDELIGPGRWVRSVRPVDIGETVVVRFPAEGEAILTRLRSQTSARIAVLDIPMLGEDLMSGMNHRVDSYNQALRQVAAAHAVECLPLHDSLASMLPAGHSPPPYRGRFGPMVRASLSHDMLHRSWDRISAANGLAVLTDHAHLNDRAAACVATLVADFIAGPGTGDTP